MKVYSCTLKKNRMGTQIQTASKNSTAVLEHLSGSHGNCIFCLLPEIEICQLQPLVRKYRWMEMNGVDRRIQSLQIHIQAVESG
jgi:hypothetical protein